TPLFLAAFGPSMTDARCDGSEGSEPYLPPPYGKKVRIPDQRHHAHRPARRPALSAPGVRVTRRAGRRPRPRRGRRRPSSSTRTARIATPERARPEPALVPRDNSPPGGSKTR